MHVGKLVRGARVLVEGGVDKFVVNIMTQGAIRSPVNINSRNVHLYSELDIPTGTIHVVRDVLQLLRSMRSTKVLSMY